MEREHVCRLPPGKQSRAEPQSIAVCLPGNRWLEGPAPSQGMCTGIPLLETSTPPRLALIPQFPSEMFGASSWRKFRYGDYSELQSGISKDCGSS